MSSVYCLEMHMLCTCHLYYCYLYMYISSVYYLGIYILGAHYLKWSWRPDSSSGDEMYITYTFAGCQLCYGF